ncbi:MAG: YtxH domain-containing protein [Actinomycetia bacterium]|nr:YtxH domain-containing protein [Actinomycetes bacterium]
MRSSKLEYFVIGLVSGIAGGVVVGLLVAPDSGTRTRRRIADGALRVADVAQGLAERAGATASMVGSRVDHYLGRDEEVAWRKVARLRDGVRRYSRTVVTP